MKGVKKRCVYEYSPFLMSCHPQGRGGFCLEERNRNSKARVPCAHCKIFRGIKGLWANLLLTTPVCIAQDVTLNCAVTSVSFQLELMPMTPALPTLRRRRDVTGSLAARLRHDVRAGALAVTVERARGLAAGPPGPGAEGAAAGTGAPAGAGAAAAGASTAPPAAFVKVHLLPDRG